jgi:hypothetical protein
LGFFSYFRPMKKPISIEVAQNDNSSRAKRYKEFNTLLNKINQLKLQLEALQAQVSSGLAFYHQEILPLYLKQQNLLVEEVQALHRAYSHPVFGRNDRKKIAALILSHCHSLFQDTDRDFSTLTDIYNFYADQTREELEAEKKLLDQERAEAMLRSFGLDVELDDEDDLETILSKAREAAERKQDEAHEHAENEARNARSEKQKLKAERERQKEKDIQKVCKNIYGDLVRLLHPDREIDESKKAAKTEAIQRVNEAYERNDLFELLRLQAEYLQKEGDALTLLPEKEFKYYLQVLKAQEQDLQYELDASAKAPGLEGYVSKNLCHPNPITTQILRQRAVKEGKEALKSHQHNLKLAKDPIVLKEALRYYEVEADEAADHDFDQLSEEMGDFFEKKGKGKKKKKR